MKSLVVVMVVLLAAVAKAGADGIVLESYTGERPADAQRLLSPVLEELSKKKFEAGDGVGRKLDARVSRASRQAKGVPGDFAAQVDRGFKAWVGGSFDESIKILVPLIENAHANTGQFAIEPGLREPLQKALIALSLAQLRIGDPGAMKATMSELIRSFPEASIARATYGPEAAGAFDGVRKEVLAQPKGTLNVKLVDETGVVFIDEAYRAVGSTTAELVPGEYRVLVLVNKVPSRAHRVTVRSGETAVVEIDAAFDVAVRTSPFVGFSFASDADRQKNEAAFAAQFARAVDASAVAIVGIDDVRGKASVIGALVSLSTGREIRRASIPLEPDPSNDRLLALARFLSGEEPAPGLDVAFANAAGGEKAARLAGDVEQPEKPRWGGWKWVTGAVGVAGLATGAVLVALDGRCSKDPPAGQPCNDLYATATPGYIALGAGAVFTGVSIYLFATQKAAPVVQPAGAGSGATIGFITRW